MKLSNETPRSPVNGISAALQQAGCGVSKRNSPKPTRRDQRVSFTLNWPNFERLDNKWLDNKWRLTT
jgi:hypothetical protein